MEAHLAGMTAKEIEELKYKLDEIREALEEAIIGLEWWNDEYPEGSSEADLGRIEKWKKLIEESK